MQSTIQQDLIVRPVTHGDTEELFFLIENNRDRIAEYFPITSSSVTNLASTEQFINRMTTGYVDGTNYLFIIEHTDTKHLCGSIFLKNFESRVPKCELGYFLDKQYEGKGIASKALQAVCTFCFEELQLNKLCIRTGIDNIASKRLAENMGFKLEGIVRNDFRTASGILVDIAYYGRIK